MKPLCIAPFVSVLVDVNRKVRPCCVWSPDHYLGDLKNQSLNQVLNNDPYQEAKSKMFNKELPIECKGCKDREDTTGWSLRLQFQPDTDIYYNLNGWEVEKLRYLELNGSNHCNLACIQCTSMYSTAWISDSKKLGHSFISPIYLGDETKLLESLEELDLSDLQYVYFKGGEPMLNPENIAALLYFEKIGIISNISLYMITNGTIAPSDDFIRLVSKAKSCNIGFSVDGTTELNTYIRWSKNNFATIENIESTMLQYSKITNVRFDMTCSIMTYNIFKLVEIRDWWISLKDKGLDVLPNIFNHLILNKEVNIRNLTDNTRNFLIGYYATHQIKNEFEPVLKTLKLPYLGNESHNDWVDYTFQLEKIRNNSIIDIEPLLENELVKIYD